MHIEEDKDEESGEEIWLISYSDLMTLLFGFFVLMYVFASTKTGDAEKVREGLAKSFGGSYVPPLEKIAKLLKQNSAESPVMQFVEVQTPKDGMEITFRSNLLFTSGSASLKPEAVEAMRMISKMISSNVEEAEIFVGGHTDDAPIHTRIYPSNWELSSARAASVVREFIETGYPPKMLVALGYADARPAYPNRDAKGDPIAENRERNRRVVIKVVTPGVVKKQTGTPKADGLPPEDGATAGAAVKPGGPAPTAPSAAAPTGTPQNSTTQSSKSN